MQQCKRPPTRCLLHPPRVLPSHHKPYVQATRCLAVIQHTLSHCDPELAHKPTTHIASQCRRHTHHRHQPTGSSNSCISTQHTGTPCTSLSSNTLQNNLYMHVSPSIMVVNMSHPFRSHPLYTLLSKLCTIGSTSSCCAVTPLSAFLLPSTDCCSAGASGCLATMVPALSCFWGLFGSGLVSCCGV